MGLTATGLGSSANQICRDMLTPCSGYFLRWMLSSICIVAPIAYCSPGPWLRTQDSLFMESEELQVTQEFLSPIQDFSLVKDVVRRIVLLFSSRVSVSEVLIDQYGNSNRGFSIHSSPGSIFEFAGIIIIAVEELFSDPENNYAKLILIAQDSNGELHACIAHVTGTQINLGPSSQVLSVKRDTFHFHG